MSRTLIILATALLLTTPACAENGSALDDAAWLASIQKAWAEEDAEFKTSPTSPLAGVQRFEIEQDETVYFAQVDGAPELSLEQVDQLAFSLEKYDGQWQWNGLDETISLTRGEDALSSGTTLAAGDRLQAGRLTVQFYPSDEKVTVLVFDPETQRIRDFETLNRFAPDRGFAVTASIEKFENPEQLEMITGRQQFKQQYRYARLHFTIDGEELGLTAYKHALEGQGSDSLFIPFTDKTSGPQSYGGGRYLFVEEPAEGDELLLDFNLATNPLCAYAAIYNCIVPTLENKLGVAINAGVKKYDHPDH